MSLTLREEVQANVLLNLIAGLEDQAEQHNEGPMREACYDVRRELVRMMPTSETPKNDHLEGLYPKWTVNRRGDLEGKHRLCEVFVLDWNHDPFAVSAALAYVAVCQSEYPLLASDLRWRAREVLSRLGEGKR